MMFPGNAEYGGAERNHERQSASILTLSPEKTCCFHVNAITLPLLTHADSGKAIAHAPSKNNQQVLRFL
jgi:hypothetical protein